MNLLLPGSAEGKKLAAIRANIRVAEETIESLAGAPLAAEDITAIVRTQLAQAADQAKAGFEYFSRPGDPPRLPVLDIGALAWLFGPEEIAARFIERLSSAAVSPGLSSHKRRGAIAKHRETVKQLQLEEEREICGLEASGWIVERNLEPDAALAIKVWREA